MAAGNRISKRLMARRSEESCSIFAFLREKRRERKKIPFRQQAEFGRPVERGFQKAELPVPDEERLLTYQQFAKVESRSGIHSVNGPASIADGCQRRKGAESQCAIARFVRRPLTAKIAKVSRRPPRKPQPCCWFLVFLAPLCVLRGCAPKSLTWTCHRRVTFVMPSASRLALFCISRG